MDWTCGKNGRGTNVNVPKVEGGGRRGRPILRWEDCLTRDLVGVGRMRARDRGEWRMRARDRGEWEE